MQQFADDSVVACPQSGINRLSADVLLAYITGNEHERLTWLDMAQSWLQLAQVSSASLESQLDKSRRNAA